MKASTDKGFVVIRELLLFYEGDLFKATKMFGKPFDEGNIEVTRLLGLGQIYFAKRNYEKVLEMFKKAVETNPRLPTNARFGMAYSFFFLNKF